MLFRMFSIAPILLSNFPFNCKSMNNDYSEVAFRFEWLCTGTLYLFKFLCEPFHELSKKFHSNYQTGDKMEDIVASPALSFIRKRRPNVSLSFCMHILALVKAAICNTNTSHRQQGISPPNGMAVRQSCEQSGRWDNAR